MQAYSKTLRLGDRTNSKKHERVKLPVLIRAVAVFTLIACFGGEGFLGYQVAGFGWVIPFVFALLVLISRMDNGIRLPFHIWLPWILLVVINLSIADTPHAMQRSVMMLSPIAVGMAVSKLSVGEKEVEAFIRLCLYMALALTGIVIMKAGVILTGALPIVTGLAAEAITSLLFSALFAARYVRGKAIAWWAVMAAIPLIAVTRTAIFAAGLSLPLTFAPMKTLKRAFILALMVIMGVGLFYTTRMQRKMFYSGKGTFADISLDNPDFRMTGRNTVINAMVARLDEAPWFGHGANASEPFVSIMTGGLTHPHNDWLRLLYDYGYTGTSVFALCILLQTAHAFIQAGRSDGETAILFYAGASSFISFILVMFTDNIILYAAFYGNLQFTILGMAYAAQESHAYEAKIPRRYSPARMAGYVYGQGRPE